MANWVTVARYTTRAQAEMAAELLSNEGIPADAVVDDAGGVHPALAFGLGSARVTVPPEAADEARELLRAFGSSGEADENQ